MRAEEVDILIWGVPEKAAHCPVWLRLCCLRADKLGMKTIIAICVAALLTTIGIAADVPGTDPWNIYDKLDPKKYEHLFPVGRSATTTTGISLQTNGIFMPLAAVTNAPPLQTTTNALQSYWPQRSWTIRGTKSSDVLYLGTIEKNGKRLVCLAPQGLGMRAVPIDDLSDEDVRAVEAFEGIERDRRK
jgi:hypothetical protein